MLSAVLERWINSKARLDTLRSCYGWVFQKFVISSGLGGSLWPTTRLEHDGHDFGPSRAPLTRETERTSKVANAGDELGSCWCLQRALIQAGTLRSNESKCE